MKKGEKKNDILQPTPMPKNTHLYVQVEAFYTIKNTSKMILNMNAYYSLKGSKCSICDILNLSDLYFSISI